MLLFLALPSVAFTSYSRQEIIDLMGTVDAHIAYVKNANARRGNQFDGQCVNYVQNARTDLVAAGVGGNAKYWAKNARRQGFFVSAVPKVGAVYVDTRGRYGHVGIVTAVEIIKNPQGALQYKLTVRDSNRKSKLKMRTNTDYVAFPRSKHFLFIHKTEGGFTAKNVIAALYQSDLLAKNSAEGAAISLSAYQNDAALVDLIVLLASQKNYALQTGFLDVLEKGFRQNLQRGAHVGEIKAYLQQLLIGVDAPRLISYIQTSNIWLPINLKHQAQVRIVPASTTTVLSESGDPTMVNTLRNADEVILQTVP